MELANATLHIGNESTVPLKGITPAQAVVLVKMHSGRAKKIPLTDIKVVGSAQSVEVAAVPDELDKEGKVLVKGTPAKYRARTSNEERARLKTLYHKQYLEAVFGPDAKMPETFADAAESWKPVPQVEADKVGNWTDEPGPLPQTTNTSPINKNPNLPKVTIETYVSSGNDPKTYESNEQISVFPSPGLEAYRAGKWDAYAKANPTLVNPKNAQ